MTEPNRLTPIERDHFASIVEASLRVSTRRHFFAWTQGIVQALVPHEILVCGVDDGEGGPPKLSFMSASRYFREEHFQAAVAAPAGVLARLAAEWQAGEGPCVVARELGTNGHAETVTGLEAAELCNAAVHGVLGPGRRPMGVYAFSRIPADCLSRRLAYLLEVLVPQVHCTFVRVTLNEQRAAGGGGRAAGGQITPREAEILRWITEGKTNADIAAILGLSPWTVKNHVQTILKKLKAQTRSHAVARAMNLGLLDSAPG